MLRSLLRGALLPLLAASALMASATAHATSTVATHADPSGAAADPVFSLAFGGGAVIVNGTPVLSLVTLSGSYSEDDANGSPHAPLELITGVSFDDWDFVFDPTSYLAAAHVLGVTVYTSGPGSFTYYLAGSAHTAADVILSVAFSDSTLTVPVSGVGGLDFGLSTVEITYGPASGLSGTTLADPEQFGFAFANYTGNPGTALGGPYTATATASFTSSAEVVVPEPVGAALVGAGLLALAVVRVRS
jgi:hypothetical protein